MTNLRKITEEEIKDYVSEVGEFEKDHRKGSSFWCWATHTFNEADIKDLRETDCVDASDFLGVCVTLSGMWDDNWGTEWDEVTYSKVEEYQELVPEQIIPEHYVTKQRTTPFKPEFE